MQRFALLTTCFFGPSRFFRAALAPASRPASPRQTHVQKAPPASKALYLFFPYLAPQRAERTPQPSISSSSPTSSVPLLTHQPFALASQLSARPSCLLPGPRLPPKGNAPPPARPPPTAPLNGPPCAFLLLAAAAGRAGRDFLPQLIRLPILDQFDHPPRNTRFRTVHHKTHIPPPPSIPSSQHIYLSRLSLRSRRPAGHHPPLSWRLRNTPLLARSLARSPTSPLLSRVPRRGPTRHTHL